MWLLYGSDVSGERSRSVNDPQPKCGWSCLFFVLLFFKSRKCWSCVVRGQRSLQTRQQIKFKKTNAMFADQQVWQLYKLHEIALDLKKQRKILEENKVIGFIRSGDYSPSAFKAKKQALFLVPLITHCYLVNSNVWVSHPVIYNSLMPAWNPTFP